MTIIIIILLAIIAYYIYRIYRQKEKILIAQRNVDVAQRALDDQTIRAQEAVKYIGERLNEERDRIEKKFADGAAKLDKEHPELKMTLTEDMIQKLIELEKTTDFKIPEYITRQMKDYKSTK